MPSTISYVPKHMVVEVQDQKTVPGGVGKSSNPTSLQPQSLLQPSELYKDVFPST